MPKPLFELLREKFNPANVKQEDGRLFVYGLEIRPQPDNSIHAYHGDERVHVADDHWDLIKFIVHLPREYLARPTKAS